MPIPLPNLDDRSYSDLMEEAQALIPNLCPTWSDHNPSDPGMMLIELLAWLTEMTLYRVNQVPDENYWTFLRLLNDQGSYNALKRDEDLASATRQTMLKLRERYRAATSEDFEHLALTAWSQTEQASELGRVRRARCIIQRNLEAPRAEQRAEIAPGHVSLVVVPDAASSDQAHDMLDEALPRPSTELRAALWRFFDQRRLLTTRHHVIGPIYAPVSVGARLYLKADAVAAQVRKAAAKLLWEFFHPLVGGPQGQGWPFGRDVHGSEIYTLLDQTPGVDYVQDISLKYGAAQTPVVVGPGEQPCVELDEHELAAVQVDEQNFVMVERI